jgi:hypothetical protein
MTEKIETAEIISEERKQENKYFLVLNKEAKLKVADDFETLKKERTEAKNKYCNIDKGENNIKEVRDAKNTLVKLRTGLTGEKGVAKADKARIKQVFDEINSEYEYKLNSLLEITVPLEKDLTKVVEDFDNKEKKAAREKQARKDALIQKINDLKQNYLLKISQMKSSNETIMVDSSELSFTEFPELIEVYNKISTELVEANARKKTDLREREDFIVKQAELKAEQDKIAKEKAELEAMKKSLNKPVVFETKEEVRETVIDDLPALDEDEISDDELEKAVNELDALMNDTFKQPEVFNPSLSEIVNTLRMRYPVIINDPYFKALEKMAGGLK